MGDTVVESVRELLPELRDRAPSTEAERTLSAEVVRALRASGLFSMFRPDAFGGGEADPVDYATAIRAVASACPSTGWSASLLGITPWHLALLDHRAQQDVWGPDPDALVSSSYAPMGKLVSVEAGFRLSGRWRGAPAARHCSWIMLGCLLIGPKGNPVDYVSTLVPSSDCTFHDTWDVVGLRGTGSMDVVVEDAFVPCHRTYGASGRDRTNGARGGSEVSALYRVPFASIHHVALTAPVIGAAEGAYEHHFGRVRSRSKLSHGGNRNVEDGFAHAAVARGAGELDAAVLQMERDLREQRQHVLRSRPVPTELRLRARRDLVRGTQRAAEALDLLFKAAGGNAVQVDGPIQRAWRDVHTGAAHLLNHVEQALALYGRWSYGLGVDDSLILV